MANQNNALGDIRAENDKRMLESAFYETPDFRTLVESFDKPIVVGRRGTGKSALCYQLRKYLEKDHEKVVIHLVPEEDQIIGLRPLFMIYGDKYSQIKAGARIAWKYALMMEVATVLIQKGKALGKDGNSFIGPIAQAWRRSGTSMATRMNFLLRHQGELLDSPQARIAGLAETLKIAQLQEELMQSVKKAGLSFVFLIDQLDEGFEPDPLGVGLVGGIVHAAVDINAQVYGIDACIFLRDNIFKSMSQLDTDYSRNIEGRFIRIHWDEHQLFDLVCARLKVAFSLQFDANRKVWNRCTAGDIQEMSGFEKCLRLTMYRPRDLISLLNDAFYHAYKQKRDTLILKDVEATAYEISNTRLDDLYKEYVIIIPTLRPLTSSFRNGPPEFSYEEAIKRIASWFNNPSLEGNYPREFEILETPQEGIRTLCSVGFLGIKDSVSNAFIFCHDGRNTNRELSGKTSLLIHPCYWIALDILRDQIDPQKTAEIHDDYEVEVFSEAPEIRTRRISQLMGKLDKIPLGASDASAFEEWCLSSIRVCFSGPLRNIELHPNKDATNRRDVVASNQSEKGAWKRILTDYQSRQVIFEVKNKIGISIDDYRQMLSYLHDDYGRLGFIVTRDDRQELYSGPELETTREMFRNHGVIIVKITGKTLYSFLSKLRSAEKLDPCDSSLNKILDVYARQYLSNAKLSHLPPKPR